MIPDRLFIMASKTAKDSACIVISNLPEDGSMEVVVRPRKKQRSKEHNALMWGARLKDISEQAWIAGKQYSPDVWHVFFKREFLPEGHEPDFDRRVLKGYVKWVELPSGERDCVGSTTKLSSYGMTQYLTEVEAYCTINLGVKFTELREEF